MIDAKPGQIGVITTYGERLFRLDSARYILGDATGHTQRQVLGAFVPLDDTGATYYLPMCDWWPLIDQLP